MAKKLSIPPEVSHVTQTLQDAGFEAYLVGGCVRDLLRGVKPKDWDITTNARPEQILGLFKHAFYENKFGTVGIVNEQATDTTVEVVEVTTYRLEATYSDSRHPDQVDFSDSLETDLKRRDFTMNAIAFDVSQETIIDPFDGQKDLKNETIRAVGEPVERFKEDALRMMRAVRLASELGFTISHETAQAITQNAVLIEKISKERIRDELIKILGSDRAMDGIWLSSKLGILKFIIPELEKGVGVAQNQAHTYDVWEHNLRTLQHAVHKKWDLDLRLAALFHDIAKPETRKWSDEKKDWTFYGHDVVGGRMTKNALSNLRFPTKTIEKVSKLVRWHMFFSDPEKITLSAVRRLIRNVGQEDVWDLMNLRTCDRIGTGRPKEQPYRLRKYKSMVEQAMMDPISVGMLKINGGDLMEHLKLSPGPKIGHILYALLEEVLEDPGLNTIDYLKKRARELNSLGEQGLENLGKQGKERRAGLEEGEVQKIRQKYWVK
jgi:tRNA nucleotidyltransferase (CCA-adding enzyme)